MRRLGFVIAVVMAMAFSYGLGRNHAVARGGSKAAHHILYFVDPMHPAYRSDKPGVAPDCGMALEPVYAQDGNGAQIESSPALPPGVVSIDGSTQRLLGLRLAHVERGGAVRDLRVVGRVSPEDTRVYRINSGVEGFIRETYGDSVGARVKKDQKLASYYAPQIVSVASGFLAATQRIPGAIGKDGARFTPQFPGVIAKEGTRSIQGYTDQLRDLGMSDAQIKQVADARELPQSIDVVAPADGFILARNISPSQHFDRSVEFYRLADLSQVWAVAEVDGADAPSVRPGAMARVGLRETGRWLPARVADSLPQSEAGGGTVKLRLEVDNPGLVLRPDMLVDVELPIHLPPATTVPLDAVMETGSGARVYVQRSDGMFEPREVITGARFGERVEILQGVRPGELVVASATFLVDSESRLTSPSSWTNPSAPVAETSGAGEHKVKALITKDPSCGMPVDPHRAAASGNTLALGGATYYFCSEHCKEVFQQHPAGASGGRRVGGR